MARFMHGKKERAAEMMAKRKRRDTHSRPPHVLVADDDADIRHSVRLLLEDSGYRVTEVGDGLTALDRIRADPDPMVVVLDLMMPRLNGSGVLDVISADRHLMARLRIVIMTAAQRTQPLFLSHQRTALRIRVIWKPFDLDDMLAAVDAAAAQLPPI